MILIRRCQTPMFTRMRSAARDVNKTWKGRQKAKVDVKKMLLPLASCFLLLAAAGLVVYEQLRGQHSCEMTYMYRQPQYKKVSLGADMERSYPQYGLYYYHEGVAMGDSAPLRLSGVPALFIPGNGGSHKQSRSSASIALQMHAAEFPKRRHFDFFTVKLNEELSGLYGGVLERQTVYVASCVEQILSLYPTTSHAPQSVVVIAHSMGGVVAQALFTLPTFNRSTLHTLILLSSPLTRPVISFDPLLYYFYQRVHKVWSEEGCVASHVTVVSIAGGQRDIQIPTHLTQTNYTINIAAPDVPRNWASADHQAVVWCRRVQLAVTRALFLLQSEREGVWELTREKGRREEVLTHLLSRGSDVPLEHTHSQMKPTSWRMLEGNSDFHVQVGYKAGYSSIATPRPQSWNHNNALLVASNTGQASWVFVCATETRDKRTNCSDLSPLASQLPPRHGTIKFAFLRAAEWPRNSAHLVMSQPRQLHPKALDKKGFLLFEVCDNVSHELRLDWLGTKHTVPANHCTITNFTLTLTEVWLVYSVELKSCDLLSVGVAAGDGSTNSGIGIELSSLARSGTSNLTVTLTLQVPYKDTPPQLLVWSQRDCELEVEAVLDIIESMKKFLVLYAPLLLPWVTAACVTGSDSHAGLELGIVLILYALASNGWIPLATDWPVLLEEGRWSVCVAVLLLVLSRGLQQAMAGAVRLVLWGGMRVCGRGAGRMVTGWACLAAAAISLSACSGLSLVFAIAAFAVQAIDSSRKGRRRRRRRGGEEEEVVCVLLCLQLLVAPSLLSWGKGLPFSFSLNPDPHFYVVVAVNVFAFLHVVAAATGSDGAVGTVRSEGSSQDGEVERSGRGACQLLLLPGAAAVPLRSLAKLTLFVATLLFSLIRAHHLAYFVLAYLTIVPLL